ERSLNDCSSIDFVCRREFDYSVVEYANGVPLSDIRGISYRDASGKVVHNPDRGDVQDLDALPNVTDVYFRDLDVRRYNVPFLLYPFVSLYTTRGCPAQCTFCLGRRRSADIRCASARRTRWARRWRRPSNTGRG